MKKRISVFFSILALLPWFTSHAGPINNTILGDEMKQIVAKQKKLHEKIAEMNTKVPVPAHIIKELSDNLYKACMLGFKAAHLRDNKTLPKSSLAMNKKLCQCISRNDDILKASVESIRLYPNFDSQGNEANRYLLKTMGPITLKCLKKHDNARYNQMQNDYKDYTIRANVSDAIMSAGQTKIALAEFYADQNRWPEGDEIDAIQPKNANKHVKSLDIGVNGLITITFKDSVFKGQTSGTVVTILPQAGRKGVINWRCGAEGTTVNKAFLPSSCRHDSK